MTAGAISGAVVGVILMALISVPFIDFQLKIFQTPPRLAIMFASLAGGVTAMGMIVEIVGAKQRRLRLESVEQRYISHPEKPQYAWDVARTRLESYLDRNIAHLRSIFALTVLVMLVGFGIVAWGLFQATQNPDALSVPIIASASGVFISFIGGSFLLIFRSIMAQSKDYVVVLERINAVGMAVQVISGLPAKEDSGLRHEATAELAKQLLDLYSSPPKKPKGKKKS